MDTSQIQEHMEVVGSDGEHVGIVDKVQGDQIKLTRRDSQAGGVHHLIPVSLVASTENFVKLSVTAEQVKSQWQEA